MSRAPRVEPAYHPLHASLGPKDVIDFVDNSLQTLAPGVMGGPPAYLEAHGVRYVPATDTAAAPGGLVSMSTGAAASLEPDTRRERLGLNSRIRQFLETEAPRAQHLYSQDDTMPRYQPLARSRARYYNDDRPPMPRHDDRPPMPRYDDRPPMPRHDDRPPMPRHDDRYHAPRGSNPAPVSHSERSASLLAELREQAQASGPPVVPGRGIASRMHTFDY
jgi:hypothetical protein